MSDIPVKIKRGQKASMPSEVNEGTIYVSTDTGVMYVDVSEDERIRICDETAISYMAQSLSADQQAQARANIGAESSGTAESFAGQAAASASAAETAKTEAVNAAVEAMNAKTVAKNYLTQTLAAKDETLEYENYARIHNNAAQAAANRAAASETDAATSASEAKGYRDEVAEMLENAEIDPANAVLVTAQTLTDSQKAQARTNIDSAKSTIVQVSDTEPTDAATEIWINTSEDWNDNIADSMVLYTTQTLTEVQKAQARANIGAATVDDILNALPMWEGGNY